MNRLPPKLPLMMGGAFLALGLVVLSLLLVRLPSATPTPQQATPPQSSPTMSGANLFANPDQPAYEPGKGFAPDARRVVDVGTLQISLEKYRVAKGRYPSSLQDLLPDFAPEQETGTSYVIPTDPETKQPYDYEVGNNSMSYQLSATLASGERYTVIQLNDP